MRRSFCPPRFKYCTLSKYHEGQCHFETLHGHLPRGDVLTLIENPVEPRCLFFKEDLHSDFIIERSFVAAPRIAVYEEKKCDAGTS